MSSLNLNGSPYRTRPEFLQSRFARNIPGPYYGDRNRLRDDIITTRSKEWRPGMVVSKTMPGIRGLSGLGETDDLFQIMKKAKTLLQRGYESAKAERQALADVLGKTKSQGRYDSNTIMSVYPSLVQAWDGYGKAAAYFTRSIMKIDLMLNHQGPWSPEEANLVYKIRDVYNAQISKLSAQERKDAGLGNPLIPILIAGAAAIAILLIGVSIAGEISGPDIVALEEKKNKAIDEIDAGVKRGEMTVAQGEERKERIRRVKPRGGFMESIGWTVAIGVALWVGWKIFSSKPAEYIAHGMSLKIASAKKEKSLSGPTLTESGPTRTELAAERAEYAKAEKEARKAEEDLYGSLKAPSLPSGKIKGPKPERKHTPRRSGKSKQMTIPGF